MLSVRLRNQKLLASTLTTAVDVVRWLGAVQAQDYAGAKWALALRARRLTDAAVDAAFNSGEILRTHVLRPTWHFVTRDDLRWLIALTGPRLRRINRLYTRRHGLDDDVLRRARGVVERALAGGRHLTRKELSAVLARARIAAAGQPLAHLVFDLEVQGVICSGPRQGNQFTYALLSERTPAAKPLPRDEALALLGRRYFDSHGPATVKDFAWWSGLTVGDARAAAAMADGEVLPRAAEPDRARGATFLLPNYDEYLIAYKDRGAVIDPVRARNLGVFTSLEYPHHLIVDGRVEGSWRRTITARSLIIDVQCYGKLTRAQMATIERQGERYGRFLGVSPEVRVER